MSTKEAFEKAMALLDIAAIKNRKLDEVQDAIRAHEAAQAKRIEELERERDEYKEKADFWRMGNDAWKSYAGQYAGERDALRARIESAPKFYVVYSVAGFPIAVHLSYPTNYKDDQVNICEVHAVPTYAVPVEPEQKTEGEA